MRGRFLRCTLRALSALAAACLFAGTAFADPLEFTLDASSLTASPGATVSFSGVITNRSGAGLGSTDLFVDFIGYDPGALSPTQTLGLVAFDIPNFTFTPSVALFDVQVLPGAPSGINSFLVSLEDVNGDVTTPLTISITVSGVPEPSSAALMLAAAALLLPLGRRRAVSSRRAHID